MHGLGTNTVVRRASSFEQSLPSPLQLAMSLERIL